MSDVRAEDIARGLRDLGVGPGDLLVVHSSLSSFGRVDGGADAAARGLAAGVSPDGSVFVPTFTYAKVPFDPAASPSFDGAITEAVRRLPSAVRSRHPTHSWAGIGPAAPDVLDGHERTTPFGPGSPLWRLWQRGARVLLAGVGHRANSLVHVAEESLKLPYLDRNRVAQVVRADGSGIDEITVRRPGCSAAFERLDGPLRAMGRVRGTTVGRARLMLMEAGDVVDVVAGMLSRDPAALLCDRPDCAACEQARRALAAARA